MFDPFRVGIGLRMGSQGRGLSALPWAIFFVPVGDLGGRRLDIFRTFRGKLPFFLHPPYRSGFRLLVGYARKKLFTALMIVSSVAASISVWIGSEMTSAQSWSAFGRARPAGTKCRNAFCCCKGTG